MPIIGLSFVGILLGLVLGIWAVAAGHAFSAADSGALNVMRYVFLAWIPILFTALFFENKKRPVMGANDDLTGCFISMAVVKYMQQHDIRFENTEVWVVLTGSEEAGLRGAKAFCKAHKNELSDVETVLSGLTQYATTTSPPSIRATSRAPLRTTRARARSLKRPQSRPVSTCPIRAFSLALPTPPPSLRRA